MLTSRQERILCKVVDDYLRTGQPVASRTIASDPELECGSSTVRNELALLEEHGLLAHPHVSAGRVPTDAGQRYLVDRMLRSEQALPVPRGRLELSLIRREIDEAMRTTTETLSQMTNLLAVVSAPSLNTATIRHIEVLALQPQLVLVVVITSTGAVSKMLATFDRAVDPGLVSWAGEYLNETVAGLQLGTSLLRRRFDDAGLGLRERTFLDALRPAFTELVSAEQRLYVGGAADLLGGVRAEELEAYRSLFDLVEKRAALLEVLGESPVDPRRPYVRVGRELDHPALREVALVGACYGLVHRALGAVSLVGPVRMDYEKALGAVRSAASELSRFVESVYDER